MMLLLKTIDVNFKSNRLGYAPGIFERQKFLGAMYAELLYKENVHLSKRVISIVDANDSVLVKCADGTTYTGDIVVGADGIRSRVREEMQRIAPPELLLKDNCSVTAEYACFFGVSSPIESLIDGELHTIFDVDVSALLFVGKGKLPQWFFITRLDRKYQGKDIPRYSKQEMEEKILEHSHFQFAKGITTKDLVDSQTALSYLALEEATHDIWTWGRLVCLGDSIHKMTPNLGQGGNQAIESAAVLTNCLVETLMAAKGEKIERTSTAKTLQKYQKARTERAKLFVKASGALTRDEALSSWKSTLRFLYIPFPSDEKFIGKFSTLPLLGGRIDWLVDVAVPRLADASKLDHLPLPARLEQYEAWNIQSRRLPRAQ
jgi:FAD dependent monooxygenase